MQLDPKADCRPWPLAGYAPGNYTCKCIDCEERFSGDKRAIRCLECAAVVANQRIQAVQPVPVVPVADEGTYEEGYDEGLRDAQGHAVEVTRAVARWLDNHLGVGNWYDQAEEGFTADDVIQGLFEAVRDPAAPVSGADNAK